MWENACALRSPAGREDEGEGDVVRNIVLSVSGGAAQTADLAAWLDEEDTLRGHVRREASPVPEGALGGELQQLVVGLASGGVATAAASVIVAWLRRRTGSVSVRVTGPDGFELEVSADQVRTMDAIQLCAQVDQLVASAWPDGPGREAGARAGGTGSARSNASISEPDSE
ncbi:hypothetical protein [Streptomyces sp. NPDC006971]|uniref:effector-associated constant component EACC1 n=1 Tax=Streptomyces sp. NPDC006971 TaxID=3154784 RepID=UPI0033C4AD7F